MIRNCQVNHLNNPLGFRMENPLIFHWVAEDLPGKKTAASRIVVHELSRTDEKITVAADTGFAQLDSLAAPVEVPLKPETRYAWTVTVRTDTGAEETSPEQYFETGHSGEPWHAKWIGCDDDEPRHPVFSKEIRPSGRVVRARLYITGLGLYEAAIDGKKIGDEFLAPGCNNYSSWVQVQTYDVTDRIGGPCMLSVTLGNGWYKGRFGFTDLQAPWYGNSWKLLAELVLSYEDGTTASIGTDESWQVTRSNITFSNIYDGEQRDDTLSSVPAVPARLTDAPEAEITDRLSVPVTISTELPVKEKIITPKGETVMDMGQNLAGIFRLKLHHPARGSRIHLQFGEVLQDDCFYRGNLRSAKAECWYTSDGSDVTLQPTFTFYGYRYVKIEGVPDVDPADFTALALTSDMHRTGALTTGDEKINRLIANADWSRMDNFIDVPTDCPQRDERMGWTGDAEVFCPTALFQSDATAFYRKFLYDLRTEQQMLGGMVPVVVPSFDQKKLCGAAWSDVATIMPWTIYQFTGDASVLAESFDSMKTWVEYMRVREEDGHRWMKQFQFGDWLALDGDGKPDSVFGGTDNGFIAEVYYLYSTRITAQTAAVLGKAEEAARYDELAKNILADIRDTFFTPVGHCSIRTQTACLLSLALGLSPRPETVADDLKDLLLHSDNKLQTGFIGTPMLCEILSETGNPYLAWQILFNEEFPGWLYEVNLGATTIWERWNSLEPDGHVSSTGMNSFNHYSYGAIVTWIRERAAGLRRDPAVPGFRKVIFAPEPHARLHYADATYDSAAGRWSARWELSSEKDITIKLHVPFDCEAEVFLPNAPAEVYSDSSNPLFASVHSESSSSISASVNGDSSHSVSASAHSDGADSSSASDSGEDEVKICHVGPGDYSVSYTATAPFRRIWHASLTLRELLSYPAAACTVREVCPRAERLPAMYREFPLPEAIDAWDPNLVPAEQLKKLDEALRKVV